MKRLLTLAALLMLVLGINAQWRKTWDFSQGFSDETKVNLNADPNWASNRTDAETGETTGWKDAVKMYGTLMANGVEIAELKGLQFSSTGLSSGNNYLLDPATIRVARANNEIILPNLAAGQKVTMVVKSANATATDRGFKGNDNLEYIEGPIGGICLGSDGFQTLVWQVKADVVDSVEVKLIAITGGLDIQSIIIDDGDSPLVEDAQPVAYIYDGSLDEDYAYVYLEGSPDKFTLTPVDASNTEETAETLRNYSAVVISPTIGADHPYLSTIRQAIAYVPVLNLNTAVYEALGYGKAVVSNTNILSVQQENEILFEGIDTTDGIELLGDGVITGVELGDYFAADDIVATAGDIVAMHIHNAKRNAYMLLPLSIDDMAAANQDNISLLIPNALSTVIATKKEVAAVGTPIISTVQENGYTTVTLAAANSNNIYYTLDGSDPTVESTLYTEPLTLTENATVKAFATGDGYTDSNIASKDVIILTQATAPAISISQEEGKSVVSFSSAEGIDIYYNYIGSTVLTESAKYTAPIELTQPTTIYAFAVGGDYLMSDLSKEVVTIEGINKYTLRWDVVSHFDANADEWGGKGQQTDADGNIINENYFFTWGKNAGAYWDETSATGEVDEDGNAIYASTLAPETYESGDWRIKSIGQVMTWEKLDLKYNIGDTNYRNPDAAEDAIGVNDQMGITNNALTFGMQPTGGPFNASLESTVPFQAPFDVVVYAGNGNDGELPTMQVETSADGETWTKLGDINFSLIKRNYKRTQLSYEGTDQVYVRILHTAAKSSGQVYDLYVMNNGEYSQGSDVTTAINDVQSSEAVRSEVYSLNGVRANAAVRGITIVRTTYADGKVVTRKVVK